MRVAVSVALVRNRTAAQNGETVSQPPLVPTPARLLLADGGPFVLTRHGEVVAGADAENAADELRRKVAVRTGIHLPAALSADAAQPGATGHIRLDLGHDGPAESYRVRVDAASVRITGADAAGLYYGVQTLVQAITARDRRWVVPAMEIDDAPRFAYRGVMLDVARHFHGVDTVRGYIERAASLKFNVLHLHLTDDQGWRVQLDSHPALAEKGSATAVGGDPGGFYTRDDYRAIVAHAAAHHMTVVPEVDVPSHTHAVSLAYPDLCERPVITDAVEAGSVHAGLPIPGEAYCGIAVGFSSLKIHDERTYSFLADVFGELAELTPGPYLHLGGDEPLGIDPADYDTFIGRVSALVAATGKTPIAWHEAGASATLAPATVGQYWGFVSPTDGADDKARAFVDRGGRVILSPADAIYLDMKFAPDSPLGLTWARGVTTAQRSYEWDAADVIDGLTDPDILGVEAPLWGETGRSADDIDALAFPRIAAAAEAAWSPPFGTSALRTWESFRTRVGGLGPLWERLGIRFTALPEIAWLADAHAGDGAASSDESDADEIDAADSERP